MEATPCSTVERRENNFALSALHMSTKEIRKIIVKRARVEYYIMYRAERNMVDPLNQLPARLTGSWSRWLLVERICSDLAGHWSEIGFYLGWHWC